MVAFFPNIQLGPSPLFHTGERIKKQGTSASRRKSDESSTFFASTRIASCPGEQACPPFQTLPYNALSVLGRVN
jgi:hypothetical protein